LPGGAALQRGRVYQGVWGAGRGRLLLRRVEWTHWLHTQQHGVRGARPGRGRTLRLYRESDRAKEQQGRQ